jgi:hypothetical protein
MAGGATVTSLRQDDLLALDPVRADPNQRLAMRAVDRRLAGDAYPKVGIAAGKHSLLERDKTAACRMSAADRQIPFGRRRIVTEQRDWIYDGTFHSCPAGVSAGRRQSRDLQILRRGLAAIADQFEFHALAFVERAQAGALHRRDMHEHVLATVGRLNEAVAFGGVEPLHSSASHLVDLLIERRSRPICTFASTKGRRPKERGASRVGRFRLHAFHETVHHALFPGLVEVDGQLVAVDMGHVPVAELLVEHAVTGRERRDGAGGFGDQFALDREGHAAFGRAAPSRTGGGRREADQLVEMRVRVVGRLARPYCVCVATSDAPQNAQCLTARLRRYAPTCKARSCV